MKIGVATVTVTSQDDARVSATATVHVTPVAVTGVALSSTALTLTAAPAGATDGTTVPLTATVAPADATDREVQWTTSDASVATLTTTGGATVKVVAHHEGTATITVTTADGGKAARCAVTVEAADAPVVRVTAISVDPTALDLEAGSPGSTGTVAAFLHHANATNQDVYRTSPATPARSPSRCRGAPPTGRAPPRPRIAPAPRPT